MSSPTVAQPLPCAHEHRVFRILESRGQAGLGEVLIRLDGVLVGGRFRLRKLYAVGGEGVVFECRDENDPATPLVAKIPLVPFHKPAELSSNFLRRRREQLREEARNLDASGSVFMPRSQGLYEFRNPLVDAARGGEFAQMEPVLVMERLPGRDLDLWLARVHRSGIPVQLMRRNLDRVAVVLLQALVDLEDHGFYYADLRPGNLRMMGRPERRIRLLDAGSLVEKGDESGRFPHVPAYLPPEVFRHKQETTDAIFPTAASQVVMAGRTLFEVATGFVPLPGVQVDVTRLRDSNVSPPVADVIEGLATGSFDDVRPALRYLTKRAVKRVANANLPEHAKPLAAVAAAAAMNAATPSQVVLVNTPSRVVGAAAPPLRPGIVRVPAHPPTAAGADVPTLDPMITDSDPGVAAAAVAAAARGAAASPRASASASASAAGAASASAPPAPPAPASPASGSPAPPARASAGSATPAGPGSAASAASPGARSAASPASPSASGSAPAAAGSASAASPPAPPRPAPAPAPVSEEVLPPASRRPWWKRLFGG